MTRATEFVSPFRDGPLVEFLLEGRQDGERVWVCVNCEHGGLRGTPAVDEHLRTDHPGWGEARMETR